MTRTFRSMYRVPFVAMLLVFVASSICLGADRPVWEVLELASVQMAGRTVYYEKSLEGRLDSVQPVYEQFLAGQVQRSALSDNMDRVITRIEQIVGGGEQPKRRETLRVLFHKMTGAYRRLADVPICVVSRASIKDYLRRGGALPGFTCDKAADSVTYNVNFGSDYGPACLVIPVSDEQPLKEQVAGCFAAFTVTPGTVLHEMVETAIVKRLRPRDPYFRWFSDGFANVIANQLVKEFVGEDEARADWSASDAKPYADVEKKLNLSYWMAEGYCIATPLDSENRLKLARYACATLEARRLVDHYGIDKVALILDKAGTKPLNSSRELFTAIEAVTGEDMRKRLARYQSFETKEQGLREFSEAFNRAMTERRHADALANLLRVIELRDDTCDLLSYANAAYLLFRMGREDVGDQVFREQLIRLKDNGSAGPYDLMQRLFVDYAIKCGNPLKAKVAAGEILLANPQSPGALAVQMADRHASGKSAEARAIAREIIELVKDGNAREVRMARDLLMRDDLRL